MSNDEPVNPKREEKAAQNEPLEPQVELQETPPVIPVSEEYVVTQVALQKPKLTLARH
jgi:hypothetical protein